MTKETVELAARATRDLATLRERRAALAAAEKVEEDRQKRHDGSLTELRRAIHEAEDRCREAGDAERLILVEAPRELLTAANNAGVEARELEVRLRDVRSIASDRKREREILAARHAGRETIDSATRMLVAAEADVAELEPVYAAALAKAAAAEAAIVRAVEAVKARALAEVVGASG